MNQRGRWVLCMSTSRKNGLVWRRHAHIRHFVSSVFPSTLAAPRQRPKQSQLYYNFTVWWFRCISSTSRIMSRRGRTAPSVVTRTPIYIISSPNNAVDVDVDVDVAITGTCWCLFPLRSPKSSDLRANILQQLVTGVPGVTIYVSLWRPRTTMYSPGTDYQVRIRLDTSYANLLCSWICGPLKKYLFVRSHEL